MSGAPNLVLVVGRAHLSSFFYRSLQKDNDFAERVKGAVRKNRRIGGQTSERDEDELLLWWKR